MFGYYYLSLPTVIIWQIGGNNDLFQAVYMLLDPNIWGLNFLTKKYNFTMAIHYILYNFRIFAV